MKWGMYDIIVRVCDGDIMKIQSVYELPIVAVLNHISYIESGGYKKTS
jgi:hypothetical protein